MRLLPPARHGRSRWRLGALLAVVATVAALAGCANVGYYWQSASGHLSLMRAARPVPDWLADPATSAARRQKLELAQRTYMDEQRVEWHDEKAKRLQRVLQALLETTLE